ncbi:MFS transporter [Foetidibacter luteolus]|uniref:MFS transporter n=1 Tax=Foetidibacter luteolus TaxID=2608880 RepID=UPI00129B0117|nr:MFS transporter [Foetidibacter luteolus]
MVQAALAVNISRRATRVAVSVFFFLAGFCFASWASRIPNIQQKLQLSEGGLGTVLLSLPVGLMVSLPFSGVLVSKFGSRKIVILAALLYACTLPFLGLVAEVWQLSLTLFFFGFFGNLFNISVNTQAVGIETIYGRSIMASFHGLWSLAGFSGGSIGTLMVSSDISPFAHFCIVSSAEILTVIVTCKYLLFSDAKHAKKQPLFVMPDSFLLKLGLIAFCCMICEGTMFEWSGVYLKKAVQASPELVPLGLTAFMSTMAAGRFTGDWLSEKLGKKTMIQMSGLVIAAGFLLAVFFPYVITTISGFLLVGIGVSSVVPLVYGTAGRSKTMPSGMAIASVSSIGYSGFLFGPPLIGFIAEASNLRWSFAVIALLGFCTTLLATFTRIEK